MADAPYRLHSYREIRERYDAFEGYETRSYQNQNERFDVSYILFNEELSAPVQKGDIIGKVVVRYDDDILNVTDIVVYENIERDNFIYFLGLIRIMLISRGTRAFLICFAIIFSAYVWLRYRRTALRRKRRAKNSYKF